jgi:curli biogenesis system outer membrane secretion channel CsgG
MKKSICLLIAFAIGLPLLAQGGLRYTIQVTKFENRAGWRANWDLGDAWGAVLTDKLNQSGNFMVIAETDMRGAAMDEQDFAQSGRTAGGKKAPKTGQMTPAQLLVKGVITAFDDGTSGGGGGVSYRGIGVRGKGKDSLIQGTVYVVDATTGLVVSSENFEAKVKQRGLKLSVSKSGFHGDVGGFKKTPAGRVMNEACEQVVTFLESQLDGIMWSATVIKGGENRIILNRGTREGVSAGDIFRCGKAEEIRDPDTGELLDSDFVKTGEIRVTKVKEKLCYAELVSGKPPRKGDSVYR